MSPRRLRALGDAALVVELGEGIDPSVNARVRALDRALAVRPCPGLLETVPAYATLLVRFDPRLVAPAAVAAALEERLADSAAAPPPGRLHEIPTLYGGDAGPDLEAVARQAGLPPAEVVARHAGAEYTAFMLGFRPGFPYLGLLPPALDTPRLATPRVRVPAGSVAIAGRQTGIYPEASPGGWNLIGRTRVRLFDPSREEPALIQPGDRVRFVPVETLPEPAHVAGVPAQAASEPSVEVVQPGLLTSVQDDGRPGWRRLGVPQGGALDGPALAAANLALGNPAAAAGLECTLVGPTLRFLATARFAVAGADLGAVLERADLGAWPVPPAVAVLARPGNVLRFAGRHAGCRAYVAFAGGLDVPRVLGACATDLGSGFGGLEGRALRAGDRLTLARSRLPVAPAAGPGPVATQAGGALPRTAPASDAPLRVRVVLGPQQEHLASASVRSFLDAAWQVSVASDRIGLRLSGPRLTHVGPAEIVSEGMLPGAIQVPPDGQPIVMLADGPTTGGYPKLACVVTADLHLLAQCVPGASRVRFEVVSA